MLSLLCLESEFILVIIIFKLRKNTPSLINLVLLQEHVDKTCYFTQLHLMKIPMR